MKEQKTAGKTGKDKG